MKSIIMNILGVSWDFGREGTRKSRKMPSQSAANRFEIESASLPGKCSVCDDFIIPYNI